MPTTGAIGVIFELARAKTSPGEVVRIAGDKPELGRWNPIDKSLSDSLMLRTSALIYPRWCMSAPVWLEPDEILDMPEMVLSYKYVIEGRYHSADRPQLYWEQRTYNRTVTLPCRPGTIWIVTDEEFGEGSAPAELASASYADLLRLNESIDPDWRWQNMCGAPPNTGSRQSSMGQASDAGARQSLGGGARMSRVQELVQELEQRADRRDRRSRLSREVRRASKGSFAARPLCEAESSASSCSGDEREALSPTPREPGQPGLAPPRDAAGPDPEPGSMPRTDSLPALAPDELLEEWDDVPVPPGSEFWDWPLDRPQRKTRLEVVERRMARMEHEEAMAEMQRKYEAMIQGLQAERDGLQAELRKKAAGEGGGRRISARRTARNGGG